MAAVKKKKIKKGFTYEGASVDVWHGTFTAVVTAVVGRRVPDTGWAATASLPGHKARCQSGRSGSACVGLEYFTGPCK